MALTLPSREAPAAGCESSINIYSNPKQICSGGKIGHGSETAKRGGCPRVVPSSSGLLKRFWRGPGRDWALGSSNTSQRQERLGGTDPSSLPAAASSSSSHNVMDVPYPAGWEGRRSQGGQMPSAQLFSRCAELCLCEDFYFLLMHGPSGRCRNGWLRLECSGCDLAVTRRGRTLACKQLPACRIPHHLTHPRDPAAVGNRAGCCLWHMKSCESSPGAPFPLPSTSLQRASPATHYKKKKEHPPEHLLPSPSALRTDVQVWVDLPEA